MRRIAPLLTLALALTLGSLAFARNPVELVRSYATVNIPLGVGASFEPITVDFGFHVRVEVERPWRNPLVANEYRTAMAMPFGMVTTAKANTREIRHEELLHVDQMEALGPAFWLAYAITWGEAFEPYPTRRGNSIARDYYNGKDVDWVDFDRMWLPSADLHRTSPQFRLTFRRDGNPSTLDIFPDYAALAGAVRSAF